MLHFLTISPSLWSINIILSLKMRLKGIIRSRRCCRPTARVAIPRSSAKSIKSCTIMGTFLTRDPICTDKSHWSFRTISSVIVWIRLDRLRIPEMILEISKILLMLTEARCFRVIKWWAGWMGHWDLSPPAREQVIDPEIMDWFLWTQQETCLQVLETRSKVRNQINFTVVSCQMQRLTWTRRVIIREIQVNTQTAVCSLASLDTNNSTSWGSQRFSQMLTAVSSLKTINHLLDRLWKTRKGTRRLQLTRTTAKQGSLVQLNSEGRKQARLAGVKIQWIETQEPCSHAYEQAKTAPEPLATQASRATERTTRAMTSTSRCPPARVCSRSRMRLASATRNCRLIGAWASLARRSSATCLLTRNLSKTKWRRRAWGTTRGTLRTHKSRTRVPQPCISPCSRIICRTMATCERITSKCFLRSRGAPIRDSEVRGPTARTTAWTTRLWIPLAMSERRSGIFIELFTIRSGLISKQEAIRLSDCKAIDFSFDVSTDLISFIRTNYFRQTWLTKSAWNVV